MSHLDTLLMTRRTIVCLGPGGVGKTTTSAALALRAASLGRRTLVLTVDPARRLANSLGLDRFENDEQEIGRDRFDAAGVPYGAPLFAMMLDTKRTFDAIVERYAPSAEARERILRSPFYAQASTRLAGSQEYMAMEKLYALTQLPPDHGRPAYDLIILDTPPTVHALDFLDAPGRLEELMSYNTDLSATSGDDEDAGIISRGGRMLGRLGLGLVKANTTILKGIGKFLGADLFTDILSFLGDFRTMAAGFRERSTAVRRYMCSSEISFVVLTGPERSSIDEGLYLAERRVAERMPLGSFVVNRVRFGPADTSSSDDGSLSAAARQYLTESAARYDALVSRDGRELARLDGRLPVAAIRVPEFADDVCDLSDLHRYGTHLMR